MDYKIIREAIATNPANSNLNETKADISGINRPSRRPTELPGSGRIGAVILLLFQPSELKEPRFVLTKRRDELRDHPGQISLPGGSQDGDESLQTTAIRETNEEIGVDPQSIEIFGSLNPVYIPPSDFTIHPFVGWFKGRPDFVIQESEVAALIEADIGQICHPESVQFGPIQNREMPLESEYFDIDGHQVWGATAKVLLDFRSRLV